MTDLHQVVRSPGAVREFGAARAELGDGGVDLRTQELRPARIALRQQMQRLCGDELPQRTFELRRRRRALLRLEAQPCEQHVPHRLPGALVIGAHQAVADRVDARPGVPALDELPKFRAARVIVQRLLIEHAQQQRAPARQEHGAVIELDTQHVRGGDVALQCQQIIADLAGARPEIVLRAERRHVPADESQLMIVGGHARIGGPDAPQRRIHDPRVIRHGGPGRAAAGARRSGVFGDAPVDGPADVALGVADHHVLVGNAHGGAERERLGDRGGALERHET